MLPLNVFSISCWGQFSGVSFTRFFITSASLFRTLLCEKRLFSNLDVDAILTFGSSGDACTSSKPCIVVGKAVRKLIAIGNPSKHRPSCIRRNLYLLVDSDNLQNASAHHSLQSMVSLSLSLTFVNIREPKNGVLELRFALGDGGEEA